MTELKYSRSYWENMSNNELDSFIEVIFNHYKEKGFPFYDLTIEAQRKEMETMDKYCEKNGVLKEGVLNQSMHCLNVAWTYFPHSWGVKCNNQKSPMEAFEEDDEFRKVIRKRLRRGTYMTDNGIRKELRTSSGIQSVSNFRPTSARAIYDKYAGDGVVWDMSCGYGGRLLGAISSKKVRHYIGTEPDIRTHKGLLDIAKNLGDGTKIEIHNIGSEDFIPEHESLDLCFTSPPYYDTEKYDNSTTQSYVKFPDKELWLNGFLMKTIENCYNGLKNNGYILINIRNVKTYTALESDFIHSMRDKFPLLTPQTNLIYQLSSINKAGYKIEPIFVYQKTLL